VRELVSPPSGAELERSFAQRDGTGPLIASGASAREDLAILIAAFARARAVELATRDSDACGSASSGSRSPREASESRRAIALATAFASVRSVKR